MFSDFNLIFATHIEKKKKTSIVEQMQSLRVLRTTKALVVGSSKKQQQQIRKISTLAGKKSTTINTTKLLFPTTIQNNKKQSTQLSVVNQKRLFSDTVPQFHQRPLSGTGGATNIPEYVVSKLDVVVRILNQFEFEFEFGFYFFFCLKIFLAFFVVYYVDMEKKDLELNFLI